MDEVFKIGVLYLVFSLQTSKKELVLISSGCVHNMAYFSYFIKDRRIMTRLNMAIWKTFLEAYLNAQNGSQLSKVSL